MDLEAFKKLYKKSYGTELDDLTAEALLKIQGETSRSRMEYEDVGVSAYSTKRPPRLNQTFVRNIVRHTESSHARAEKMLDLKSTQGESKPGESSSKRRLHEQDLRDGRASGSSSRGSEREWDRVRSSGINRHSNNRPNRDALPRQRNDNEPVERRSGNGRDRGRDRARERSRSPGS